MSFDASSFGGFSSMLGGGQEETPLTPSQVTDPLRQARQDINTGISQQESLLKASADKNLQQPNRVVDPLLDQLITHFGPGPDKAQGELGQLLKEAGF